MPLLIPQPFALVELFGVLRMVELQRTESLIQHTVGGGNVAIGPKVGHIVATFDKLNQLFHNQFPFSWWGFLLTSELYHTLVKLSRGFVENNLQLIFNLCYACFCLASTSSSFNPNGTVGVVPCQDEGSRSLEAVPLDNDSIPQVMG